MDPLRGVHVQGTPVDPVARRSRAMLEPPSGLEEARILGRRRHALLAARGELLVRQQQRVDERVAEHALGVHLLLGRPQLACAVPHTHDAAWREWCTERGMHGGASIV